MCRSRQPRSHAKDGRWAWLVLSAAWLTNVVILGIAMSFGVLIPELVGYFKKSRQSSAWVPSIVFSLSTFLGPLTGALVNRFGCRAVAMSGAAMCTLSLVITSFAEQMEFMYFSFGVLFGFGCSCILITGFLIVAKYFTKWQSLAVGIVAGGFGAGSLVYGPCLELLLSAVGWRWTFRILAAITAVVVPVVCVYGPVEVEGNNNSNSNSKQKNVPRRKLFDCSVWKDCGFMLVVSAVCLGLFAKAIPLVHLAQHAKDLGISDKGFARLYLFLGLAGTISRPASGVLCQVKKINVLFVFQISVILIGVLYFLLPILTSYELMVLFCILYGLIDGVFSTAENIVILNCFKNPKRKASAFGISMMASSLAVGGGPPVAGLIADVFGSYNPAFYMAGTCNILSAVILSFVPCTKKDHENRAEIVPADDDLESIVQPQVLYESTV